MQSTNVLLAKNYLLALILKYITRRASSLKSQLNVRLVMRAVELYSLTSVRVRVCPMSCVGKLSESVSWPVNESLALY